MKPSILAGIGVGLATGGWMLAEFALGLHDDPAGAGRWTGFLSLAFPILGACWLVAASRPHTRTQALREGFIFGGTGGLVGGAAIYVYFAVINPGYAIEGRAADAGAQALLGFTGALVLGTILTMTVHAIVRQKGT